MGTPRIAAIDGLRALAILAVLGCHGLGNILPGGFFGVDVFFVISGFVITRSLASEWDRTGLVRPGTFFGRRVLRLWPAFGAMLLAVLTLAIASDSTGYRWSVLVAALSISNWARAFADWDGGLLGHTWSLSAEEQFYLIWPALLVLTGASAWTRPGTGYRDCRGERMAAPAARVRRLACAPLFRTRHALRRPADRMSPRHCASGLGRP